MNRTKVKNKYISSSVINKNNLNGFESTKEFFHVTDLEIFNEIIKS